MHPAVAAVASIGTRACLSRCETRRESTGAVVIPRLWSLDRCRGLDGCWTQGREAQHSSQLVRTSEGDVEGAVTTPTTLVVVDQAFFVGNPDRRVMITTFTLIYSDSANLEFFFNNPPATQDPANRPAIAQTPLTWSWSSVLL